MTNAAAQALGLPLLEAFVSSSPDRLPDEWYIPKYFHSVEMDPHTLDGKIGV